MWARLSAAVLILTVLVGAPAMAAAQEPPITTYELKLRDGSRLYGTIEVVDEQTISFRTITGTLLTPARADIVSLEPVTGIVRGGEFLADDPNRTRLFFGPTGRALPKGQVYFGTFQIIMPWVQVGVTDRFSIGGGTPLVFGLDESERPFWITPRIQLFDRDAFHAGAGAIHILGFDGESAGIVYGVTTTGTASSSLTVGAGMAYNTDDGRAAVVMIGGDHRIRRNLKLITENYVWKGGGGILSGGVRFIGDRLSADVGLAVPLNVGALVAFPIVNFVYVF
ncbi:MAG TPA: hypothetical protein VFO14_20915 [Vicinamibacterales bacterium]|nr:hypothetical protein [Vicinamibacterales bacterium]